ncbi:MAG: acetate--CoA ligase family protein, partial [Balneolaceae bacterium]
QDWFLPVSLAEVVGEVAGAHHKTVITSIMGKASVGDALKILQKRRIPNVAFPERSASLLSAMNARRQWLKSEQNSLDETFKVDMSKAKKAVQDKNWEALLKLYGINFPKQKMAKSSDEAVRIFNEMKGRVAMKLVSDTFSHKSDIGGVILGLQNEDEIRAAWKKIKSAVENNDGEMNGVLIQQMIEGAQEVIIGLVQDAQFGPMVLFGTGGTDVELYKDVQTAISPISRVRAKELINSTKAGLKLKGWRRLSPRDEKAVIDSIIRLGQIASDFPQIKELEINPLCVMEDGNGAFAVDVRGETTS